MIRWLVLVALAGPLAGWAAPRLTIELRPAVRAPGVVVTLGELALLHSPDLALLRSVVDLPVARLPTGGAMQVLPRAALVAAIRRSTGIADEQLAWQGAEQTQLTAAVRTLRGEEIARAAEAAVHAWWAEQGGAGAAELLAVPRDLETPDAVLRLQPRPIAQPSARSRVLVWVEVWAGTRFVRAVPVPFALDAAPSTVPRSIAAAGRRATSASAVRVDAPAIQEPAVLRGQWAALRTEAGAVLIETRVEVLQDGELGQKVRVRQPGAASAVLATVTAPGLLEVAR